MNKAIIIGNLGKDPEHRSTTSGLSVCNFSIATTEKWKDESGEKKEKTEWHNVSVFGKLADVCSKYLTKGSKVCIEGKIQTRQWEDKNGVKRYTTEIIADHLEMLGTKQNTESQSEEPAF